MSHAPTHDLAIIIVSTNEALWLTRCLTTVFAQAAGARLDVVVVDNESTDGTREVVESSFPRARVVGSRNRGFGHANNRGLETTSARYALFLNPDTEIVKGTFEELVGALDARPQVGLAGVRQLTGDGEVFPTIRRFPSVSRAVGEALACERWPIHPAWAGERVLDLDVYEREGECDWTSGSFMCVRREALQSAGWLDERFFIYAEEPDLCLRVKRAGWSVRHLPTMTIVHHAGKGGVRPRMVAQDAYARRQYADKHFTPVRRTAYLAAVGARHLIRASLPDSGGERREAARVALRALGRRSPPPFGEPPPTALAVGSSDGMPAAAPRTSASASPQPRQPAPPSERLAQAAPPSERLAQAAPPSERLAQAAQPSERLAQAAQRSER